MKFASMLLGAAAARRSFDLLNLEETAEEKTARETREAGEKTAAIAAFTLAATTADAKQVACSAEAACAEADGVTPVCATATITYPTLTGAEDGVTECATDATKCGSATTET